MALFSGPNAVGLGFVISPLWGSLGIQQRRRAAWQRSNPAQAPHEKSGRGPYVFCCVVFRIPLYGMTRPLLVL